MNYSKILAEGTSDLIEIFPWSDLVPDDTVVWSYNSIFTPHDFFIRSGRDLYDALKVISMNSGKDLSSSIAKLLKVLNDGTYVPEYEVHRSDSDAKFPFTHLYKKGLSLPDIHFGYNIAVIEISRNLVAVATKVDPATGLVNISAAMFGFKR